MANVLGGGVAQSAGADEHEQSLMAAAGDEHGAPEASASRKVGDINVRIDSAGAASPLTDGAYIEFLYAVQHGDARTLAERLDGVHGAEGLYAPVYQINGSDARFNLLDVALIYAQSYHKDGAPEGTRSPITAEQRDTVIRVLLDHEFAEKAQSVHVHTINGRKVTKVCPPASATYLTIVEGSDKEIGEGGGEHRALPSDIVGRLASEPRFIASHAANTLIGTLRQGSVSALSSLLGAEAIQEMLQSRDIRVRVGKNPQTLVAYAASQGKTTEACMLLEAGARYFQEEIGRLPKEAGEVIGLTNPGFVVNEAAEELRLQGRLNEGRGMAARGGGARAASVAGAGGGGGAPEAATMKEKADRLVARVRTVFENVVAASNAIAVGDTDRLGRLLEDDSVRSRVQRLGMRVRIEATGREFPFVDYAAVRGQTMAACMLMNAGAPYIKRRVGFFGNHTPAKAAENAGHADTAAALRAMKEYLRFGGRLNQADGRQDFAGVPTEDIKAHTIGLMRGIVGIAVEESREADRATGAERMARVGSARSIDSDDSAAPSRGDALEEAAAPSAILGGSTVGRSVSPAERVAEPERAAPAAAGGAYEALADADRGLDGIGSEPAAEDAGKGGFASRVAKKAGYSRL